VSKSCFYLDEKLVNAYVYEQHLSLAELVVVIVRRRLIGPLKARSASESGRRSLPT